MSGEIHHAIYWRSQIVGHVQGIKVDMFHCYGKWIPGKGAATAEFMASLAEPDAQLWIGVGANKPTHTVECVPEEEIEMVFRPNPPETW